MAQEAAEGLAVELAAELAAEREAAAVADELVDSLNLAGNDGFVASEERYFFTQSATTSTTTTTTTTQPNSEFNCKKNIFLIIVRKFRIFHHQKYFTPPGILTLCLKLWPITKAGQEKPDVNNIFLNLRFLRTI